MLKHRMDFHIGYGITLTICKGKKVGDCHFPLLGLNKAMMIATLMSFDTLCFSPLAIYMHASRNLVFVKYSP